ncbi:hypothetical protein ACO2Q2_11875 [Dyella sp. KRB-257]
MTDFDTGHGHRTGVHPDGADEIRRGSLKGIDASVPRERDSL